MQKRIDNEGRDCTRCGDYQVWANFPKDSHGTRGYRPSCKGCAARIYAKVKVRDAPLKKK